jgi:aryl-alcohol dehydrogenase
MEIDAAILRNTHGPFQIERLVLAEPRADEVVVRLVAVGLCHTDLTIMHGLMPLPLPLVLGHEGAGVVLSTGSAVTGVQVGDHVVLSYATCGACDACRSEAKPYCDNFPALNFGGKRADGSVTIHDRDGLPVNACFFGQSSFASHALVRERDVVKVRRDVPLKYLGPMGCGFLTGAGTVLNVLRARSHSRLAVFGAGAVGCAAIMAAKHLGCSNIIAFDRVDSRLTLAQSLGATQVIRADTGSLASTLASLGGIDLAVDTTGVPAVVAAAVGALRTRGVCALLGMCNDMRLELDIRALLGGKTIVGVREGNADPMILIPQLIELYLAGKFPIDRLIAFYPAADISRAVADAESGRIIKPVLEFSQE